MGTTSIEAVAAAAPKARKWFQLYMWRDRAAAARWSQRAQRRGYEALVLTVDVPVAGPRLRDVRNGFSIPPKLTCETVANAAVHPGWWVNLLTTEPLRFASLQSWGATIAELIDLLFDPTMTMDDVRALREDWSGPLVVKGMQTVEDARRVVAAGADAVVVSNHGGRQLDRAPDPAAGAAGRGGAVRGPRRGVGRHRDHGRRRRRRGSRSRRRACLVGRAYLYGLMAGGERGVQRAAEILAREVRRTMQLLGVAQSPSSRRTVRLRRERATVPPGPARSYGAPWTSSRSCRRFEQFAYTFGGVAPIRRITPGTVLRLWSEDAFCGVLRA